jgi:hypothetical protein
MGYRAHYPCQTCPLPLLLAIPPAGEFPAAPIASPCCRPPIHPLTLLRTTAACRSMPLLRSPRCHGQALVAKSPAQRSLLAPAHEHL